jgi:hypothetical protein
MEPSWLFHVLRSHYEGGSLSAGTEKHGRAKRAAIIQDNKLTIFFIHLNIFSSIFFFLHQQKNQSTNSYTL